MLVGCVTHGTSTIALGPGERTPEGEVLVFGRFCLLDDDGEEADFGSPIHVSAVLAGYRKEHELIISSRTYGSSTRQCLEGDGTFFWHLPPGNYQISWYRSISGMMYTATPIAAEFHVPEGDRPVYIGTCRCKELSSERSVHSDLSEASARLATEFPEVEGGPRVSMMHMPKLSR
jgi:hypothetical protein